ncbi:MAG: S-layer homology domain-containing protein, partial [Acidimicrobiaceae bacterium]|nr:S-layer homology domain-containing protein [Acidimicrobiaceae bacterium]
MRGIGRIATAAVITVVVAAAVVSAPSAAAQQDRYPDVTGGVHKPAIDALGGTGMFDGTLCDDGRFCPTKPIERSTMAVWLIRALTDADPPPVEDSRFADVPASEWWAGHVELLAQLGITAGCGTAPLRYCPERPVTRA